MNDEYKLCETCGAYSDAFKELVWVAGQEDPVKYVCLECGSETSLGTTTINESGSKDS